MAASEKGHNSMHHRFAAGMKPVSSTQIAAQTTRK